MPSAHFLLLPPTAQGSRGGHGRLRKHLRCNNDTEKCMCPEGQNKLPHMDQAVNLWAAGHFLSSLTLPEFRITLRASSYVYCTAPCPCCVKPLTSRICQSPPEIRMDVFKHRCRLKAKGALKHLFCPETIGQQAPKPTARFVRGCFQIETCTTSILRSFDFAKC